MLAEVGAPTLRGPARRLLSLHPALVLAPFALAALAVAVLHPNAASWYDDEAGYVGLARDLVHGHYLTGRDDAVASSNQYPNLWFGPGLPLILVPLVWIHAPITVVRLVGPLFFVGAVVLFQRLLRLSLPRWAATAGALALALYLPAYTVLAFVHSEPVAVFCVVSTLYATTRYLDAGRMRHLLVAGAALGWLALTRVEYGWLEIVLLAVAAIAFGIRRTQTTRRLAAVACIGLVVCLPWLAYTRSVTGNWLYWGGSGPLSAFWITASYPGGTGDWHGANEVFSDPRLASLRPFFRPLVGRDLNAQNAAFQHAAIENVKRDPGGVARNVLDNVTRMWTNIPYSFQPFKWTALGFAVPNLLILVGLLLSLVRSRGRPLSAEVIAFGSLALLSLIMHSLLSAYPRMLVPVMPLLIWLACTFAFAGSLRSVQREPGNARHPG